MADVDNTDLYGFDDDAQSDSGCAIVEVGSNKYVAGLVWLPLDSDTSSARKKESVVQARAAQMNLVMTHVKEVHGIESSNAGLAKVAKKNLKKFAGKVPLGVALAETVSEERSDLNSWLGVFEYEPGKFSLIGVADGILIPGLDLLGDTDEALGWLSEFLPLRSWDLVLADTEVILDRIKTINSTLEIEQFDLEDLLGDVASKRWSKKDKLINVSSSINTSTKILMLVVLAVSGIAIAGFTFWQTLEANKQAEFLRKANLESEAQRQIAIAQAKKRVEAATPKPSWVDLPSANSWLDQCYKAMSNLPINLAAWRLTSINCSDNQTIGSYERFGGTTMDDAWHAAQSLKLIGAISELNVLPQNAVLIINWEESSPRGEATYPAPKLDYWLRNWISNLQVREFDSTIAPDPEPTPGPVDDEAVDLLGMAGATPPPPDWDRYTWELKTKSSPVFGVLLLQDLSASVIKEVLVEVNDGVRQGWSAKGESFVSKD